MANLMFHKGHLGNLPFAQNKFPLCRQNCPTLHCIDVTAPRARLAQKITMAMQCTLVANGKKSPLQLSSKNLMLMVSSAILSDSFHHFQIRTFLLTKDN